MLMIILSLFSSARQVFQTRAALQAEILALRHQLLNRPVKFVDEYVRIRDTVISNVAPNLD